MVITHQHPPTFTYHAIILKLFYYDYNYLPCLDGIFPVGDYSPEQSAEQFLFRTGTSRACGTIIVYRDSAFEFDESFAGEVTGLRLDGGQIVASIPGVTVSPSRADVLITDNNGRSSVM